MVNLDTQQTFALDHQKELLDEAARRRLINSSGSTAREKASSTSVRARFASQLRRVADWIEPRQSGSPVRVLHAVAHREIPWS